jgi:hypothetical protein
MPFELYLEKTGYLQMNVVAAQPLKNKAVIEITAENKTNC